MKQTFLLSVFLVSMYACSYGQKSSQPVQKSIQKVNLVMYAIENMYVDEVDNNKLAEDAIVGLLEKLDPHSTYSSAEEVNDLKEPLQGNFEGIGVQFNMMTDTLYIVQVIPGGPSEKVGVMPGDRIIYVGDSLIAGVKIKTSDVMKMLRGSKGTVVNIKIMRKRNPELLNFRIVRDVIPIYSLDASYMLDKKTGYIKLNRFGATTHEEYSEALKKLKAQGMENLILDLQGNGGGYLGAAINIANDFLKQGSLIVYTEGAHQRRDDARASYSGSMGKGRLAVLVDESSASASEIVAGAIQDWDRGVIIGRRTFGKGLVQAPIDLPDGSMIRLTTSRYYTPSGRSIQKPYESGNLESYNKDLIERYNHGEMVSADSIHFPDSLKTKTLVTGRTVYGGGGIMPDYFIPLDTTRVTDLYRSMTGASVIYRYILNLVDENRNQYLAKYNSFDAFKKNFTMTDSMLEELLDMYCKDVDEGESPRELTEKDREDWEKSKPLIRVIIKSRIASDIYDNSKFFEIINETYNDPLKKALEIINNPKEYDKLLGKD